MGQCVYIVTQSFFNERDKERFGVNYILSKGHQVVVIDITKYLYKKLTVSNEKYKTEHNLKVCQCKNIHSIKDFIRKEGSGVAFLYLNESYKSIRVKKILRLNQIKYGSVQSGFIPAAVHDRTQTRNIITRIGLGIKKYGLFRLIDIVIDRLYINIFDLEADDFLFTTNKAISSNLLGENIPNKITVINSRDYDVYLNCKNKPGLKSGKYVVFIDQDLFGCKDFLRNGIDLGLDKATYFEELNTFFRFVEETYNCDVVIAAHPKSNINEISNEYCGRPVFINETALLIRDCGFVINYYSTAISFAVLNKKPIVFISSEELKNTVVQEHVLAFSKSLGNSITYIPSNNLMNDLQVKSERYTDYENRYVKSIDTNLSSWEFIYDDLKECNFLH